MPDPRDPHPATAGLPPGRSTAVPPHPATVAQPRAPVGQPASRPPHSATVAQPRAALPGPPPRPPHPALAGAGPRREAAPCDTAQRRIAPHPATAPRAPVPHPTNAARPSLVAQRAAADSKSPASAFTPSAAALDDFFAAVGRDDAQFADRIAFHPLIVVKELDVASVDLGFDNTSMSARTGRIQIFADVKVTLPPDAPPNLLLEVGFVQALTRMQIDLTWGDGSLSIAHAAASPPLVDTHSSTPSTDYPFYDRMGARDATGEYRSHTFQRGSGIAKVWLEDQPLVPICHKSAAAHLDGYGHIRWQKGPGAAAAAAASTRLQSAEAGYTFDTWLVAKVGSRFVPLGRVAWTAGFKVTLARVDNVLGTDSPTYTIERKLDTNAASTTAIPDSVLTGGKSAYDVYFRKK